MCSECKSCGPPEDATLSILDLYKNFLVERKCNLIQESQITSIFKGCFREQSVRISDPWGKSDPRKIVEFYFCLKHPRMTTANVQGEVVSALVLNSM